MEAFLLTINSKSGILAPEVVEMPRYSRAVSNTLVYHLMLRGNALKAIFRDHEDKDCFVDNVLLKRKSAPLT
jgi:hypothetical protein